MPHGRVFRNSAPQEGQRAEQTRGGGRHEHRDARPMTMIEASETSNRNTQASRKFAACTPGHDVEAGNERHRQPPAAAMITPVCRPRRLG